MTKTKKTTKKQDEEKFTLIDLVTNCETPYPQIIMNLSKEGLIPQLEKEQKLKHYGCTIEPSMTLKEFNKIVEA